MNGYIYIYKSVHVVASSSAAVVVLLGKTAAQAPTISI